MHNLTAQLFKMGSAYLMALLDDVLARLNNGKYNKANHSNLPKTNNTRKNMIQGK
jgi:hypothetical protein